MEILLNQREAMVLEAASHIGKKLKRHVRGDTFAQQFLHFSVLRCGRLTPMILKQLGLDTSEDLGETVMSLVKSGLMGASPQDSIRDFAGIYNISNIWNERTKDDWYTWGTKKEDCDFLTEYFSKENKN